MLTRLRHHNFSIYKTKQSRENYKYLENGKSFYDEKKAFSSFLKGFRWSKKIPTLTTLSVIRYFWYWRQAIGFLVCFSSINLPYRIIWQIYQTDFQFQLPLLIYITILTSKAHKTESSIGVTQIFLYLKATAKFAQVKVEKIFF